MVSSNSTNKNIRNHPPIIIFDVDGVLINSKGHQLAVLELFHDKRHRWNEELLKQTTSLEVLRKFEASDTPSNRSSLKKMNEAFRELLPGRVRRWLFIGRLARKIRPYERKYGGLIPKTYETIKILHEKYGIIFGICTSSEGSRVEKWLSRTGLDKYIKIFNSRDERKRVGLKPSPGPILDVLVKIKQYYNLGPIDKSKVLFVGDNVTDIYAAKNAKVKSAAVLSGHGYKKELKQAKPDFIFNSIAEIPEKIHIIFN